KQFSDPRHRQSFLGRYRHGHKWTLVDSHAQEGSEENDKAQSSMCNRTPLMWLRATLAGPLSAAPTADHTKSRSTPSVGPAEGSEEISNGAGDSRCLLGLGRPWRGPVREKILTRLNDGQNVHPGDIS